MNGNLFNMRQIYPHEKKLIVLAIILLIVVFSKGCTTTHQGLPDNVFECQDGYMYQVTPQKKIIIMEDGVFKGCTDGIIFLRGKNEN